MKIYEITTNEDTPTKSYCKNTPKDQMGASALASCKSRGHVTRDGNKSHKLGPKASSRTKVGGKKIKGEKYNGPLPHYGSGS
jgi:hypothetical protein